MILDKENMLSLNQAVASTVNSDHTVDLGPIEHLTKMLHEKQYIELKVIVSQTFSGPSTAALSAKLQSSNDGSAYTDVFASAVYPLPVLKAGFQIAVWRLSHGFTDRYLRIRYEKTGTGTITGGRLTAGIVYERHTNRPVNTFSSYDWLGKSNVLAAWSVRRLFSDYAGALVRLRRDSNPQAEKDFYYTTHGTLDTQAIAAWLSDGEADNAFVVRWYDQSGNNHHADNATASQQPQLVDDNNMTIENNRPALNFASDTNGYRAILGIQNNMHDALEAENKPMSVVSVSRVFNTDTNFDKILDMRHIGGSNSVVTAPYRYSKKIYAQKRTITATVVHLTSTTNWPTTGLALVSYFFDGTTGRLYSGKTEVGINANFVLSGTPDYQAARLGGWNNGGNEKPLFRGAMSEVLVYNVDIHPRRHDIFGNLKTYYNI